MTQEFRLFFWIVAGVALVIGGIWAAWRLFSGKQTTRAVMDTPSAGAELLHVERVGGGRVRIRLNGQDVAGTNEIGDPQVRTAVRLLVSALGGASEAGANAGAGAEQPVAPVVPLPLMPDDEMRRPLVERMRESFAKPQAYPHAPSSRKPETAAAAAPPWMFAGINEIVERLRRDAPGVPDIELSGEGAEIRVWFDGNAYRGVDEVPDERARALIRAAIAQWERE